MNVEQPKLEKLRADIDAIGKLRPVSVLVVDDQPSFCMLIRDLLNKYNHLTVDEANCGPEALNKIAKKSYDVVLLDVKMPCMDGLSVRRAIKESHPLMRVVFCTAHLDWPGLADALSDGCVQIIGKNFLEKSLAEIFEPLCTAKTISN